ncbi:MAG: hypothetical protein BWY09_02982 [Candidatus Hydrogenedentes bacterium ADurb.Bin179]|nr:MAG: hypothetical protein BWY09_02982 [Candidatus Hydrogenedentes bacterium ADurb.Bin179]
MPPVIRRTGFHGNRQQADGQHNDKGRRSQLFDGFDWIRGKRKQGKHQHKHPRKNNHAVESGKSGLVVHVHFYKAFE